MNDYSSRDAKHRFEHESYRAKGQTSYSGVAKNLKERSRWQALLADHHEQRNRTVTVLCKGTLKQEPNLLRCKRKQRRLLELSVHFMITTD